MKRLFLIDGHSLIFRMYYAFLRRPMVNSKGEDTSILYGFTKFLLELIRRENPTHLAVMFDPPAKTFRHELFPEYKANRSATPELVKEALEPLSAIVKALGIPVLMKPGYEADDVIGTVARRGAAKGYEVYMVTPDKDLGQMISDGIFQYKPGKAGDDAEIWDKSRVCGQFGIQDPLQIIDILSIWGDAADNIHGVDGVGEVGAKKLVGKYGSIENIYSHLDELTPKLRSAFEAAQSYIGMSKTLATIKSDVDIDVDEESLRLDVSYNSEVAEIFARYEFPSLKALLPACEDCDAGPAAETLPKCVQFTQIPIENVISGALEARMIAIRPADDGRIAICSKNGCAFAERNDIRIKQLVENKDIVKCGHGVKEIWSGQILDLEIMHYLLNPERTHKLEILVLAYLNLDIALCGDNEPGTESKSGPAAPMVFDLFSQPVESADVNRDNTLALREASAILRIAPMLREELRKQNLLKLYEDVEMPLIEVLADMETVGVKVDVPHLKNYSRQLSEELSDIERRAREMVDEPVLNLSSPRQVGNVIFEKLALNPKVKRTSRGDYPTDEETLSAIADKHPFVGELLEFRALKKLISTYLDPLPSLVNPSTGRIHTTFNQALTATGRLSSVRPNLQNIPIRTERGREIRKAFVSGFPGGYIVSADYSQIELRLMAHLSGDPGLVEAFRKGADIHSDTASRIFGVPLNEVSADQRRQAKVANFGIIYGISAFGLAQRMGISRTDAKNFIEQYFTHYPKVQEYMHDSIEVARQKGYVETIFARKRYLQDINSKNVNVRSLAERNAINAPIQGSAADIIKLAMIKVYHDLKEAGLRSRMVLQVHDELVIDVAPEELSRVMDIVKFGMEGVCSLSVPLTAECNYGYSWLEAH